uniref:Uncharacterized protein n=1 Tax=Anguilla anguilla TaxID=7936 RepID=A0A0E9UV78_ANGAN
MTLFHFKLLHLCRSMFRKEMCVFCHRGSLLDFAERRPVNYIVDIQ